MITVAAIRMEQFGVQFYQASLTARDVSKLVRFEVLSYGEKAHQPVRGTAGKGKSKVNWDLLERRIAANEKSYQRQIISKKIEELVQYYEQCREARNLPSIPGAVIIASEEPLKFESLGEDWANLGVLKVPEREGVLRAIDGQHRLLALHNDLERFGHDIFHVPAVIFDRLPEDHVVQMFVTINAKHTRLNPSHLVSLAGRQLYADANRAAAHDVIRALTEREDSALHGDIKLLGVGRGRVAQAPLAQELKRLFESDLFGGPKKSEAFRDDSRKFFVNYFKQVAMLFNTAWQGRKYSIKSAPALRAFIRVAPDVVRRLDQEHADRTDFRAIGRVIAPWGRRIGDMRFETDSAWKRNGSGIDQLAKELRLALQYPEGAAF
jgi:DGQHR domain-containing protein